MNFLDIGELSQYISQSFDIKQEMSWLVQVFVIILFTLLASFFASRFLLRLERRLQKTKSEWDNIFVDVIRRPVSVLIWIIGIGFAAKLIYKATEAPILSGIDTLRDIGIIWVAAWGIRRFIIRFEKNYIESREKQGKKVDKTTCHAVAKLASASVIISAALIALQALGFSISGVLAFGGVGGIAIGFAARDMLANFFGALIIYLDKPFKVGDWVRSPDKEIEGTVEFIGWRMTTIRTFDKRPLYVPNSVFSTIALENPSRMTHRRIYETIGIRYDDMHKMTDIVTDVKRMLIDDPEIDNSQTMIVNFNKFGPSSCDFFVYTFTHTTDWIKFHEIKHDILLKIANIIDYHGAEIAFPTQTLHIEGIENNPLPSSPIESLSSQNKTKQDSN